jgi:thioredoxin 1
MKSSAIYLLSFAAIFLLCAQMRLASHSVASPPDIYDQNADAHRDIAMAVANAAKTSRNVVLIFGANWCPDCHALEDQMHRPELAATIKRNFVAVNIDLGMYDKNLDVAQKYHVPVNRGIPTIVILNGRGNALYVMDQGQFADARSMSYESIREFFEKWKPKR